MYKLTADHLLRMNVPKLHWQAKLSKIPGELKHKRVIQDYIENIQKNVSTGQGLYLFGDYGRGKSALAAVCAKAAFTIGGYWSYWLKAKELPRFIIEDVLFDASETCYERCRTVDLLIIDEFQLRATIKYTENAIEDLIRHRLDDCLATIVTTNIVLTDLKGSYPALYSVLQDGLYPVKIQGYDFRADKKGIING